MIEKNAILLHKCFKLIHFVAMGLDMSIIACILPDASLEEQTRLAFQDRHTDIRMEVGLMEEGIRQAAKLADDAVSEGGGIAILASMHEPATPYLIKALAHSDAGVRRRAMYCLRFAGESEEAPYLLPASDLRRAALAVAKLLVDPVTEVRLEAARCVGVNLVLARRPQKADRKNR